jgi:hypothetical protein
MSHYNNQHRNRPNSVQRWNNLGFLLPPGSCWSEAGKIEIDPDQHVADTIRLVFTSSRTSGS